MQRLANSVSLLASGTERISGVVNTIGVAVLAGMMFLTAIDVGLRYLLRMPIKGAYEISQFMLVIVVFLAIAYTGVRRSHVGVTGLVSWFPETVRRIISSLNPIICIYVLFLIIWQSVVRALWLEGKGAESPVLEIPIHPFLFVVTFGSLLLSLVFLRDFLNYLFQGAKSYRQVLLRALPGTVALVLLCLITFSMDQLSGITPAMVGIAGVVFLFLLMFLTGMPIAFALALTGFLGMSFIRGTDSALTVLGTTPYGIPSNYSWAVLPLFVLMGEFCTVAGLGGKLYDMAYKFVGRLPGGLAMATVGGCAGFAAVCGSSISTAVTMGTVALPEMRKYRYDFSLATGSVAAGGTLGVLIPPSITFILYGVLVEESIGALFMAGILPGILLASLFMLSIYIRALRNPNLAPRRLAGDIRDKLESLKDAWGILLLFVVVIGGLYGGVFTPTEGGGIGAFGAFIIGLIQRGFTRQSFTHSLLEAGNITAMALTILIGASIFGYFLSVSKLPFLLAEFITGLQIPSYGILASILMIFLILGCVMPAIPMIILMVPIILPIAVTLRFDLVWFGVLMVIMYEMAVITPPFGINVFALGGMAPDIPIYTIFRGILPFLLMMIVAVVIVAAFPQIALFLPNLLR